MKQLSVKIDKYEYILDFSGFSQPLRVKMKISDVGLAEQPDEPESMSYKKLQIEPWTLGQHMRALEECFYWENNQGRLNAESYALVLLRESVHQEAEENLQDFLPIALWWASGGYGYQDEFSSAIDTSDTGAVAGEWLSLDSKVKVKLKVWTMAECFAALDQALEIENDAPQAFKIVSYLRAMLNACVVAIQPEIKLDSLNAAAMHRLLNSILCLNCAGADTDGDESFEHQDLSSSSPYIQQLMRDTAQQLNVDLQTMLTKQGKDIERGLSIIRTDVSPSPGMVSSRVTHEASHLAQYQDAVVINIV